jgi:hypothetical protein
MNRFIIITAILALCLTGLVPAGFAATPAPVAAVMRERVQNPVVTDALLGALAYLEDTQIRNRPGKGHPTCDTTHEGDGAKNEVSLNLPFRENMAMPAPPMLKLRNLAGEWACFVHFLPKKTGFNGRNLVAVQDSNMFMTAFIGYPLFWYDDTGMPEGRRFVDQTLKLAMQNIKVFKRGESYNFWKALPGHFGRVERTGPLNIPVEMVQQMGKAFLNPKLDRFFAWLTRGLKAPPKYWVEQCLDPKLNSTGADALFNIPNDADDTSTAVTFQAMFAKRFPQDSEKPDLLALKLMSNFRDLGRSREDGRDAWKGKDSGAFLTWLKDEAPPTFATPETGVIPLNANNVDCVVNANVAFALAYNNLKRQPGYLECLNLLAAACEKHAWPEGGLYYPQYMIFPYTVTRAWRDGGAREGPMAAAMEKLLKNMLDEQAAWGKKDPMRVGAFPGGEDRSDHLATALGLSSLLNLGRETAQRAGELDRYDRAVTAAVAYLCRNAKARDLTYPTTKRIFAHPQFKSKTWASGLFFAASFWDLAHWRSEAFTVAMVAEALTKYVLAYDLDQCKLGKRHLLLKADPTARWGLSLEGR